MSRHSLTTPNELRVPAKFLKRGGLADQDKSIELAVRLIEYMCEQLGLDDLGDTELLDFGCGVKFTQGLINHSLPIKKYVGVDIDREIIDFLREHVHDSRFEYFHVNAHNEMYNPGGELLSEAATLPIDGRRFDVICLFSVFSHLAPHDYGTMLKLLRRYIKPDGRLFFTGLIDELTEGGYGLMDRPAEMAKHLGNNPVPVAGTIERFRDLNPDEPLLLAVYSEKYARELIGIAGWEVVSFLRPSRVGRQHKFICAPR